VEAPIAVAVVSWNRREDLARALEALYADQQAGLCEAWVVDNASSDGSPAMVRERFPWVHLIESDENLGYGRAVNLVAERSQSPWLAPANQDTMVWPGALRQMLATGHAHPGAAAVAPRLVLADGSTQHSVHPFPTVGLTLSYNLGLHRVSGRIGDRLCLEGHWDPDRRREVPWAVGAFLLVRRTAFAAVGGFDPRQWMYAEDLDLAWRLRRDGWRMVYEPDAWVGHVHESATRQAFGARTLERFMAASYDWMARRRGAAVTFMVATVNLCGAGARLALASLQPDSDAPAREELARWVRAHRGGLRAVVGPRRGSLRDMGAQRPPAPVRLRRELKTAGRRVQRQLAQRHFPDDKARTTPKFALIDTAFERFAPRSLVDLGGVWAVEGAYTFHAVREQPLEAATLVDELVHPELERRAARLGVRTVRGNFGNRDVQAQVGPAELVLFYDILLHQVGPDWDELLAGWSKTARVVAVTCPVFRGERTLRLPDLPRDEYLDLVPDQENHRLLHARLDEQHPERGRPWRDVHDVWQWAITDHDLRAAMGRLGFELAMFENRGPFAGLERFDDCNYLFARPKELHGRDR